MLTWGLQSDWTAQPVISFFSDRLVSVIMFYRICIRLIDRKGTGHRIRSFIACELIRTTEKLLPIGTFCCDSKLTVRSELSVGERQRWAALD